MEGLASADLGERTQIGVSGNFPMLPVSYVFPLLAWNRRAKYPTLQLILFIYSRLGNRPWTFRFYFGMSRQAHDFPSDVSLRNITGSVLAYGVVSVIIIFIGFASDNIIAAFPIPTLI